MGWYYSYPSSTSCIHCAANFTLYMCTIFVTMLTKLIKPNKKTPWYCTFQFKQPWETNCEECFTFTFCKIIAARKLSIFFWLPDCQQVISYSNRVDVDHDHTYQSCDYLSVVFSTFPIGVQPTYCSATSLLMDCAHHVSDRAEHGKEGIPRSDLSPGSGYSKKQFRGILV